MFNFASSSVRIKHFFFHIIIMSSSKKSVSSSSNFDNQMIDLVDDFDNQIFVVYDKFVSFFSIERFILLKVFVDIENVRRRCFQLKKFVI